MKTPTKVTLIVTGALVVAAVVAIVVTLLNRPGAPAPETDGSALPGTRSTSYVLDEVGPEAPTLVEFLDFECEACGGLYPVIEQVREQYRGKINYAFRYFPIQAHFNSMNAALAVEAAGQQGKAEEMYHRMYQTLGEWGEKQTSEAPRFRAYAEEFGIDMAAYDATVADPATQDLIRVDFNEGVAWGVEGTPTFFLDGKKLTLTQLSDLTDALDRAIAD